MLPYSSSHVHCRVNRRVVSYYCIASNTIYIQANAPHRKLISSRTQLACSCCSCYVRLLGVSEV